ncbi:MAG: ComF family protein [Patescibacteria group bacterium]|nr:ComF family protein [Patescibacteria group bacterium]
MLKRAGKVFLDFLFPIACLGCGRDDYYFCPDCAKKLDLYLNNSCFYCGARTFLGQTCVRCGEKYALDQVLAFGYFSCSLLEKIIYELKYQSVFLVSRDLAGAMFNAGQIKEFLKKDKKNILVPVPMSKSKERKRGYNQAGILARDLGKVSGNYVCQELLLKKQERKTQMKIKSRKQRRENVENVFEVRREELSRKPELIGKNIILIDDVITSGATLESCAVVLKRAGFKRVSGLAAARAGYQKN